MTKKTSFITVLIAVFVGLFLAVSTASAVPSKVPGGVTSRVKKINAYLDKTESRLKSGSTDRNDLDRAKDDLATIKGSYPDYAAHPDVVAAENRILQVGKSFDASQSSKKDKRAQEESASSAQDKVYVDWANRMSPYKADTKDGSKGNFGVSTEDIQVLLANNKNYEEAKSVYAEFLQSGIDKDAHYELRAAEYDIKVSILNYEQSRDRIPDRASEKIEAAIKWMDERKAEGKTVALDRSQGEEIELLLEKSNKLFPDTDRIKSLNARKAELDKKIEAADKSVLESRRMKADQYKGRDSGELKKMAESVVLKNNPGAKVLKVNVTSQDWTRESVVEWTDTTQSAFQHRVTDGIYAQVTAKAGTECYLFTLYLNRDDIGGKKRPLTGHVMYKERILEKHAK